MNLIYHLMHDAALCLDQAPELSLRFRVAYWPCLTSESSSKVVNDSRHLQAAVIKMAQPRCSGKRAPSNHDHISSILVECIHAQVPFYNLNDNRQPWDNQPCRQLVPREQHRYRCLSALVKQHASIQIRIADHLCCSWRSFTSLTLANVDTATAWPSAVTVRNWLAGEKTKH